MQKKLYQITDKVNSRKIAEFLSKDGQLLLPFLDLICNTEQAVDELIDVVGKAAIESVLLLSAQQIAGPKQPGRITGDIGWHGRQSGVVSLSERKLRIEKPRLRKKGKGVGKEVAITAYDAMVMNSRLGSRILEILMKGVSTRKYKEILPEMVDTVGVSKSQISREFVAASEKHLKQLCERQFDDRNILAIYIDGSKALRCAIDAVYGSKNPVQRCRNHKIRNVLGHLPDDQKEQVKCAMKSAFSMEAKKGKQKLKQLAKWLEQEYPSAMSSLLEGLDEMFTINKLGLPKELRRCLGSTNVIESPNSGIRSRTRRVKNWQDHGMVVRWVAASLLDMEQRFKRIMGYQQLWMLEAKLKELNEETDIDGKSKVA